MIRRLRRKLVWMVMGVVTLILLGTFFALLVTTQRNNQRMSLGVLRQALTAADFSGGGRPPLAQGRPSPNQGTPTPMRQPVLVVALDGAGTVSVLSNQLHFLPQEEITPLAQLAAAKAEPVGVLSDQALRYLREETETGMRIAFMDISMERELLNTQLLYSLLVGGLALLAFFLLSLFLARWAVGPVEVAWEQQKQFLANASHELKTPLTVILSNAEMLRAQTDPDAPQNARRLTHIHAEAVRMKRLVEDMLTLARSDSREGAPVHSRVDMSYLVTSVALMYEPICYDEGKNLSYDIAADLWVEGDLTGLQQVVHILLDNARKYAPPQGAIRLRLQKTEHQRLLLQVFNEGSPIPREELEKIFLRFYRRDAARSGHGSFGLGLSIAQSIVQGHGGRIWADSDGITGNCFSVILPLA